MLFANGHHVIGSREYMRKGAPESRGLGRGEPDAKVYSPNKRPLQNGSTISNGGGSPNTGIQLRNGL